MAGIPDVAALIGTVPSFPNVPTKFNPAGLGYTVFFRKDTWRHFTGIVQMPVEGPRGTPAKIVDWSGGLWKRIVTWVAMREGAMPDPLPDDPQFPENETLEFSDFSTVSPNLQASGVNYTYKMEGVYIYALKHKPDDRRPLGKRPTDQGPEQYVKVPSGTPNSGGRIGAV